MHHRILTAIFALLFPFGGAFAACTDADIGTIAIDAQWCTEQCDGKSGHQNQCDGMGKMKQCTENSVRDGFTGCHTGDNDVNNRFNACFSERRDDVMKRVRPLMGCVSEKPTEPKLVIKNIDFNQKMIPASDDKQAIIADFTLLGKGTYRSITVAFERNGEKVWNIATYAVNFDNDAENVLHVKITAYDRTVKDVSRNRYSVAGTLTIIGPP